MKQAISFSRTVYSVGIVSWATLILVVSISAFSSCQKSYSSRTLSATNADTLLVQLNTEELLAQLLFLQNDKHPFPYAVGGKAAKNTSFYSYDLLQPISILPASPNLPLDKNTQILSPNSIHLAACTSQQVVQEYWVELQQLFAQRKWQWIELNTMAAKAVNDLQIAFEHQRPLFPGKLQIGKEKYSKWQIGNRPTDFLVAAETRPEDAQLLQLWKAGALGFYLTGDPALLHAQLLRLVNENEIGENELRQRVRRIFELKQQTWPEETKINSSNILELDVRLRESSLTLANDPDGYVPLRVNDTLLVISPTNHTYFEQQARSYTHIKVLQVAPDARTLRGKSIVWVASNKLSTNQLNTARQLGVSNRLVFLNFGFPEQLEALADISPTLQAYSASIAEQQLAAQALFGGITISGQYPSLLGAQYQTQFQPTTRPQSRLRYPVVGEKVPLFARIDSLALSAIAQGAFPGCQVFVAHKGRVLLNKSYGHHTYQRAKEVDNHHLYDIASLSKPVGTVTAVMQLYNQNKINLMHPVGRYLSAGGLQKVRTKLKPNNLFDAKLYELLVHKSGISPNPPIRNYYYYDYLLNRKLGKARTPTLPPIPSLLGNLSEGVQLPENMESESEFVNRNFNYYYSDKPNNQTLPHPVAGNMYFKTNFRDSLLADLLLLPVARKKSYVYSDVNFQVLKMVVDSVGKQPMEQQLQSIYKRLGIRRLAYQPTRIFPLQELVPTEYDAQWRKQLVHGYVHDPLAALLNGIGGNAGLFANAESLGIYGQWLLQQGSYGGEEIISQHVVQLFTQLQSAHNRALGFDNAERNTVVGSLASPKSFGHTGFTGTCLWVDPENELVYVFLSNRIHPNEKNKLISSLHVRERIHNIAYQTLVSGKLAR